MTDEERITIVGGGLAGSLIAIMLGKQGYSVNVYEKNSDFRNKTVAAGRSINLALSDRGLVALKSVGLEEKVKDLLIPMKGRLIHTNGNTTFQPYGKDDSEFINSISRLSLNQLLLDKASDDPKITLYFKHKCRGYDNRTNTLHMEDEDGNYYTLSPKALIGADGANSAIRTSMLKMGRFNYSQQYMDYGYKELEIPAGSNDDFQLEKNALHIWPREKFVMIALPNPDKTFTLTLFAPFTGEFGFDQLVHEEEISLFFQKHFPDVYPMVSNLVHDIKHNPTGRLVTIKCDPWNKGRAVLIGDAAHAIIPFYGQGMNAAFEDCRILSEMIKQIDNLEFDWINTINKFSKRRKPNGDAIADLSYDNFVEMRDGVTDEDFLKRKEVEIQLYDRYEEIISKYAMVTFHPEMDYKTAKIKGEILERTLLKYQQKKGKITEDMLDEIKVDIVNQFNEL